MIIIKDKNSSESLNIKKEILKTRVQLEKLNSIQFMTPFIDNSSVIEIGVIKTLNQNIIFSDIKLWTNHYKTIDVNHKRFKKNLEPLNNNEIKINIKKDIKRILDIINLKFGIVRFEYIYSHKDNSYYFIDMTNSSTGCKNCLIYNLFNVNSAEDIFNIIFRYQES